MSENELNDEKFAQTILDMIKDKNPKFIEAVIWFAENIELFDLLFDNETVVSKNEYIDLIKTYLNKNDYRTAMILSYKMNNIYN